MSFGEFFHKCLKTYNHVFGDGVSRQIQHEYRVAEMDRENKFQVEQIELRNAQSRELQSIIHNYRVEFERERSRMEASPFFMPEPDAMAMIWEEYNSNHLPIFLVAPFWEEQKNSRDSDLGGGDYNFCNSIDRSWRESGIDQYCTCIGGVFRRPLRQTGVDIRIIQKVLRNLPIIVAYGYYDGEAVHPMISTWNTFPGPGVNRITTYDGNAFISTGQSRADLSNTISHAMVGGVGTLLGVQSDGTVSYFERLMAIQAGQIVPQAKNILKISNGASRTVRKSFG